MSETKKANIHKSSLALTCFKVLFGLYFICTVIITIIQMYATYSKAEENLEKEAETTFKSISEALTLGVHSFDNKLVIKLLDGLISTPQIQAAAIIDEENLTYVAKGIKKEIDGKLYKTRTYPGLVKLSTFDLFHKDDYLKNYKLKVGTIILYRSHDSILKRVKDGFYYLIIAAFLNICCLGLIFFWVFKKWLIKPLSNLIYHTESINLDKLDKISLGLSSSERNELHILEASLNEMIESIQYSKEEITQKNKELSENYRELFDLSEELRKANEVVVENNLNLKDEVIEANTELSLSYKKTEAMLLNVNKAIFVVDSKGIIQSPVSKHCDDLFKKSIVGENGLKLLFFHLKDASKEKELILKAWSLIFNQTKSQFLSVESYFPKHVIHPDKDQESGRHLSIHYAPLFDNKDKLNHLMFLVEDVTDEVLEKIKIKKEVLYYDLMMEIIPISNKNELVKNIPGYLKLNVNLLESLLNPMKAKNKFLKDPMNQLLMVLRKGEEKSFQPLTHFQNLLSKLRKKFQDTDIDLALFSVDAITQVIELLNTYVEVFNILHKNKMGPEVNFVISKNFNDSVEEKIQDLDRLMINILEYVFLVRKIEDLDKDKIESAPSKAKLYTEYDRTIDLLMKRSRLISYLLKVLGQKDKSQLFYNFSNLLTYMPSKNKLTEAALVNHLINPYAAIQKMNTMPQNS